MLLFVLAFLEHKVNQSMEPSAFDHFDPSYHVQLLVHSGFYYVRQLTQMYNLNDIK